jgi:hypothetical protein
MVRQLNLCIKSTLQNPPVGIVRRDFALSAKRGPLPRRRRPNDISGFELFKMDSVVDQRTPVWSDRNGRCDAVISQALGRKDDATSN